MSGEFNSKLFPLPSNGAITKNVFIPRIWPGVTVSSTTALQSILAENHTKWHVFFNDRGFHNHNAHAALTLWCLGADQAILRASYEASNEYQRPAFNSPNPITRLNWKDHLGDDKYYSAYLDFFTSELEGKDFGAILEEFIFSPAANFSENATKQPEMLNRFLDGLIHPIIHTGFGVEFSIPGVFAEGMAQAAVHKGQSTNVIPLSYFVPAEVGLASRFASAVGFADKTEKPDVHAFTILARVLADPSLALVEAPGPGFYDKIMLKYGDTILKYVDQWTLQGDLGKKLEELLWTNALIYGVGGAESAEVFNADFFYMHLVTSSLLLPSIFSQVKRESQGLLLRSYFAVCLAWYVGQGRAQINIEAFFNNPKTLHPSAPGAHPTPHGGARPTPTSHIAITPEPWLQIIQSTLVHPDDHLAKLQRALSEFSSLYGSTPAGCFQGTELKDAELIDGTLFVRAAGLTMSRMGWVREGQAPLEDVWDRHGFFNPA